MQTSRSRTLRPPWPLTVAAGLALWGLAAVSQGAAGPPALSRPGHEGDVRMYQAITTRVAAGQAYHAAVAAEMPTRGYAVRPVFNWRLPTLTWLNSLPPSPVWGRIGLWVLGLTVIGLWTAAIGNRIPSVTVASAVVVAIATVAVLLATDGIYLHEVWAGFLIAASLASWALGRTTLSVVFGLTAILFRELALPYVVVMIILAIAESRRREAAGWFATLVIFAGFWTWHVQRILANMPTDGLRNGWLVAGGWPFVLTASRSSVFLMLLPAWLVAVLVPVAWAGFWRWTDATGRRAAIIVTVYFAMFMVIGRADNWYWGFLVAPLIPLGLFGYFFDPARTRAGTP